MNTKTLITSLFLVLICAGSSAQEQTVTAKPGAILVSIIGSVNKPSRYLMQQGGTVVEALASAGWPTKTADLTKVRIIHRTSADKPDTSTIDVGRILNGETKDIPLRDGDILYLTDLVPK